MNALTNTTTAGPVPFDFQGHEVRTVSRPDGSHWFLAADICRVLGIANTSQAVARLDDDDKAMFGIGLPGSAPTFVSEPGLYALVFRSEKAEAKAFQKWVTSVVLPSLRKRGVYIAGEERPIPEGLSAEELAAEEKRLLDQSRLVFAHLAAVQAEKDAQLAAAKARHLENRKDRDEALRDLKRLLRPTRRA